MDIFLVQMAVLFLPGLIWASLDARYARTERAGQVELFIRAFMFGLATYAVLYLIYTVSGRDFSTVELKSPEDGVLLTQTIVDEIAWSLPLSFTLAVLWIALSTHKILPRFLQHIRATKRYGDEDVWDYTFNSSNASVEYVHVRDFERGITYAGWVDVFSESGKLRELVLRDVEIFDANGNKTDAPLLYLAREPNNIHIEFPYQKE